MLAPWKVLQLPHCAPKPPQSESSNRNQSEEKKADTDLPVGTERALGGLEDDELHAAFPYGIARKNHFPERGA